MAFALLALVAVGIVVAYVLPQRAQEQGDYAFVRTDDRYSAELRVVRGTAKRLETAPRRPAAPATPLLTTGAARAQATREAAMSRPVAPLDRAVDAVSREHHAYRAQRAGVIARRREAARRRLGVLGVVTAFAIAAWVGTAVLSWPALVAGTLTAVAAGVIAFGARAAAAERAADARLRRAVREMDAAATATQALRRVTVERAHGVDAEPSDVETQAIRIVTERDLGRGDGVQRGSSSARPWTPREMPAPAHTLKPSAAVRSARPLRDSDIAASTTDPHVAPEAPAEEQAPALTGTSPDTAALDAILQRRRESA